MNFATATYRGAGEINSAMLRVYNNMFLAIATSTIVSLLVASSSAAMAFFFTGFMKWIVLFAPLVAVLVFSFAADNFSKTQLQMFLHGFAALMGLSLSTIFVVFTLGSIFSAFMGALVLFGTMSFYGYFTKQSLDSLGKYLFIGLIAIIIASVINVFVGNTLAATVISALSILVFLGLTAYDTQKIREMISYDNDGRVEVLGALSLYLDFINIFINLLQLFGGRKD